MQTPANGAHAEWAAYHAAQAAHAASLADYHARRAEAARATGSLDRAYRNEDLARHYGRVADSRRAYAADYAARATLA